MDATDIDLIVVIKVLRNLATEYSAMPMSARGTLTLLTSAGLLALSEPVQKALANMQLSLEETEDFKLFRERHENKGN